MNSLTKTLATMLAFLWIGRLLAQSDGDHTISNPAGQTFLAPDATVIDVMSNPVDPVNMTIGLTPAGDATLRIRGDELLQFDEFDGSY